MKLKHKCLYCQHTTSRMWNLKRHMQSVHGIKKSNSNANSDDVIPHYQLKYQPSQEEHQYGKRFKDASTQYSENDINHSLIMILIILQFNLIQPTQVIKNSRKRRTII